MFPQEMKLATHNFKENSEADKWPASNYSPYQEGQFEGNQRQKPLNNLDTLQQLAEEAFVLNVF